MSRLSDVSSIPRVYKSSIEGAEYFGMELLTGEDMSKLRNRIRDVNPTKLIPINIASYFARQMVGNLQEMHKRGYVHRDVKPSNFIRKNKKSNLFYTIDFGLAKMVNTLIVALKLSYLLKSFCFKSIVMKMEMFGNRRELLNFVVQPSMLPHLPIMVFINVQEMISSV